ncbi:hypothetical protein [Azospirillum thermophilum]|uniref:Uncharacterized protein n=1 Tax=Azospirillum thermophilum TaxID=2202148 RepID=A0A2S2CYG0_9PROT|nr:hypothetical protein [Azospirillum thermophilum]AWK89440.1 hypothetical protein DEW08_25770 [Azospirillum thermophilum]
MFDWFEKMIREVIWKAISDFFRDLAGKGEEAIRDKLRSLTAGEQLSSSPLVKVLVVDNAADTLTLLVRGSFPIGGVTPFMRLEIVVSRSDIDLTFAEAPVRVKAWRTVLGDLTIKDGKLLEGASASATTAGPGSGRDRSTSSRSG